jgi:AcrR family transcriptional regulator
MKKPEEQPGFRYNDHDCKCKLANKLWAPFRASGFQQLRMDDIAKQMDISKATLYKYFSSKDEIVELIVDQFVQGIEENDAADLPGAAASYVERFRNTFVRTLLIAGYRSEPFLKDLRETFPELYGKLESAIAARIERLRQFYQQGMKEGVFNEQNATLLIMQDELIFRNLMDPVYLMKYSLTLRNALWDYYLIKKRQLLVSAEQDIAGDDAIRERLDRLASKFMYGG